MTTPVVVVTNDRAIITDVVAAGANTVSSDDFLVLTAPLTHDLRAV